MSKKNSLEEFEYFTNEDIDRIQNNYMVSIFDDIIDNYDLYNVLDYGCGNGLFGAYFKKKTECILTGVDGSPHALAKASERGYDNTILITDFSLKKLPLESETFDLVICKDILEHLLNPFMVIRESARVLKRSGKLLIHVPNHFPLLDRIKFLFTKNIDTQCYFPDSDEFSFPHIRFFTFKGLIEKMNHEGFEIIQNYSYNFARIFRGISRIPFGIALSRKMALWSPDNFASGFTLFLKKLH